MDLGLLLDVHGILYHLVRDDDDNDNDDITTTMQIKMMTTQL